MTKILVPIDFSPVTRSVVREARKLAELMDAELLLLTVVQPPVLTADFQGLPVDFSQYVMAAEASARARLKKLARTIGASGRTVTALVRMGPATPEILEEIRDKRPDYVVIGSHGHNALYNFVVGSTTASVIKCNLAPVVVVGTGSGK